MNLKEQYENKCSKLCNMNCVDKIPMLLQYFKEDINSERRKDRIKTFAQLIKILEKRDVIGPESTDGLQFIISKVSPENNFVWRTGDPRRPLTESQKGSRQRVLPDVDPNPEVRIHNLIRHEIGVKWRELARNLHISEGHIDTLNDFYRGYIPDMVEEILQYHRSLITNDEVWRSTLKTALEEARRRDLSRQIDSIVRLYYLNNTNLLAN